MKRTIVILIVVLALLALALLGIMIAGIVNGGLNLGRVWPGSAGLVNTQTLSLEGVDTLSVDYISESVRFYAGNDDEVVVKEYMNRDEQELFARITREGGTLRIEHGRRSGILFLNSRVEIYLPESYRGALSVRSVSGSLRLEEDLQLERLEVNTVSGSIRLQSVTAPEIQAASTSGSLKAGYLAGRANLHTVSGSIKVEGGRGGGVYASTSGSIRLRVDGEPGDIDASSRSGSVHISIPPGQSFSFQAKTTSGGIHTSFAGQLSELRDRAASGVIGSSPTFALRASSTSGSIHVDEE